MEKIQTNYKTFTPIFLFLFLLTLLFLGYIKAIITNQIPYLFLIGPCFLLIMYFAEKRAKPGYYFSQAGIFSKNRKDDVFTPWNEVEIKKTHFGKMKIQIAENESIFPFNIIDQKSIMTLTKKYCPDDHELYKFVKEYAKKKNLPF